MAGVEGRLEEVGDGLFAYLQEPGSWGYSNAGLVTGGEESLLIDTLFDERSARRMLATMRDAAPAAHRIGTVVNTHGNGDHCFGNAVVEGAEIIATKGCVEDLREGPPSQNHLLLRLGRMVKTLGGVGHGLGRALGAVGVPQVAWLADAAPFALELFDDFDFAGTSLRLPDRTFTGRLRLQVGDRRVELIEVGAAHTRGDAYVYLPDDRVVYTGDLLFHQAHPVVWSGPVSRWIEACHELAALDVDVVVPGHGPLADKQALEDTGSYLAWLLDEARARYDAGVSLDDAVRDLTLSPAYRNWIDSERVYVNLRTIYRELSGDDTEPHILELFAAMARYRAGRL